ncbi:MmcQ/YjbR family DNA-binding protein [Pelagibacterium xiamenense]|uniref:MmcQ/YjbR family DNA-binding protein n=1 Tax=Pelagibacterium xiamenense TaxID=2901140 RepID=UPI001E632472|nr:MmcQ/YjbR family DNA-binding protein [Pelagibacterium xiamenense]MCD7058769.1 MmcQ/YjbR family DNA-binding protein [Pelagibacterium xiamenense]
MTLFDRAQFEAMIAALPAVEIVHQWGDASVGKVGAPGSGKIFAILSSWSTEAPAIAFKCSDMSFEMLPTLDGVRPAPYLARAKWVQVQPGSALSEDDIRAYITQAHGLVAAKLTRAVRAQFGLQSRLHRGPDRA